MSTKQCLSVPISSIFFVMCKFMINYVFLAIYVLSALTLNLAEHVLLSAGSYRSTLTNVHFVEED